MKQEEKKEIRARMRAGETVEEILQDAKFQGRNKEVRETAGKYQRLSLLAKGMPYPEIARRELQAKGIENPTKEQIRAISKSIAVMASVEELVEPLKAKKEEVSRRLEAGQSVTEIVADRSLNVCEEAVKAWQGKEKKAPVRVPKQAKQAKKRERPTVEERNFMITQILAGKSPEEISQMRKLQGLSQEKIQQICQEDAWVEPASRLVDYDIIAKNTGKKQNTLYALAKNRRVQGETIARIRARKKEQLKEKVQKDDGTSIETIAQELEIDVTTATKLANLWKGTSEKGKRKVYQREEKMAVVEQMLKGKTPEEIGQMEEFQAYTLESIQEVCQEKAWMREVLQMVPYAKVAEEHNLNLSVIYKDGREYTVDGKSLAQIRAEKEIQIKQALQQETDLEKIAAQFDVELAVVQTYQQEQAKQQTVPTKSVRGASQEEKDKILEQFLAGKTPAEISQMQEFCEYSPQGLEKFCQTKYWMVLAMQLLPYQKIAEQLETKDSTIKIACSRTIYQGKNITKIRQEKKARLQEELRKGEKSVEVLAQELNIDLEVARSIQAEQQPKQVKKEPTGIPVTPPKPIQPQVTRPIPTPKPVKSREERKQAVQKNSAYLRMRIMQGKYRSKSQGGGQQKPEKTSAKPENVQSELERIAIEKLLNSLERKVAEAEKEMSKLERKPIMQALYQEAKALEKYTLLSSQAERFRKVMYGKAVELYMSGCGPEPHARMTRMQKVADRKMIGAIEEELEQTTDLEKLQSFSSQLSRISGQSIFLKERLSGIVNRKITKIRSEQAVYRLYYEVPPEVEQIITGVTSGNLDVAKANEVIEALAERKVAGNPAKGRFALTKEQQKRQIQMQIRGAISKQAERFPVEAPDETYRLLQELGIQETMLNLRAIIDNQVKRKKFTEAKAFCKIYGNAGTEEEKRAAYGIRNQIRCAEIGDLVLRGIQGEISPEGAANFWNTLETGIRMGNVKMAQVVLGKTADGTTDITLADVWPENLKQQQR